MTLYLPISQGELLTTIKSMIFSFISIMVRNLLFLIIVIASFIGQSLVGKPSENIINGSLISFIFKYKF